MIDTKVKEMIDNCVKNSNEFRQQYKEDIFLCILPLDYNRACLCQRNKVKIPRFVKNSIIIRDYYICGKPYKSDEKENNRLL